MISGHNSPSRRGPYRGGFTRLCCPNFPATGAQWLAPGPGRLAEANLVSADASYPQSSSSCSSSTSRHSPMHKR
jgi:hypothetical protein